MDCQSAAVETRRTSRREQSRASYLRVAKAHVSLPRGRGPTWSRDLWLSAMSYLGPSTCYGMKKSSFDSVQTSQDMDKAFIPVIAERHPRHYRIKGGVPKEP